MSEYEKGLIRTDRGLFIDKGNQVFDIRHEDFEGGAREDRSSNYKQILAAVTLAAAQTTGGAVFIPPGTWQGDNNTVTVPNNVSIILAVGAVLENLSFSSASGSDLRFIGGTYLGSGGSILDNPLNVWGTDVMVRDVVVKDEDFPTPDGPNWGTGMFIRRDATRVYAANVKFLMGDNDLVAIQGKQIIVQGGYGNANDDGVVVKSGTNSPGAQDIIVQGFITEGNADVFAIGTEVTTTVRNMVVQGLIGRETNRGVYLKPGKLEAGSGGTVDGVVIQGVGVCDPAGVNFGTLIHVFVQRDTTLRGTVIQGVTGYARATTDETNPRGIDVSVSNTDGVGTCLVDDMLIQGVSFRDPSQGVTGGDGKPLETGIYIEEDAAGATIRDLRIKDVYIDGVQGTGIYVDAVAGNEILLENIRIKNYGRANTSANAGLKLVGATTVVKVKNLKLDSPESNPRILIIDDTGAQVIAEQAVVRLGTIAAATVDRIPVWIAPERCVVYEAFIVNAATLAADGSNYSTYTLRKETGGGAITGATFNTSATGFTAHTPRTFQTAYFSTATSANSRFARSDVLTFDKAVTGSGSALDEAILVIRYMPY